jgi:hypothetical protein
MGVCVGADDVAVDERGTFAGAAVGDGLLEGLEAGDGVGAVDFGEMEIGELFEQVRDVAAWSVDFDGDGDSVAVVLDYDEDGEFEVGSDADGFPELALGGGAFADGDVDDFVAVEVDGVELTVVAFALLCGFGMLGEVEGGFGAAYGLEALRGGGGGLRDDVELRAGPVRGHLAAAAGRVGSRADGLEEVFFDGGAEGEREAAVAVVGEEPVVGGAEREGGGDEQGFVASAGDLEKDLLLIFEDDLAVVGTAREVHEAINLDELFGGKAVGAAIAGGCVFGRYFEFSA